MKGWILLIAILLTGCSRVKDLTERNTFVDIAHRSQESTYAEKKDTTFNYHPAPEKSQNRYATDSSYLETSLAWSAAKWEKGILSHTIRNKPVIPIRVPAMVQIYTRVVRDTVTEYLELTDEHTITVEKFRFMNAFFYYSGVTTWLIMILYIALKIWKIYRLHRK